MRRVIVFALLCSSRSLGAHGPCRRSAAVGIHVQRRRTAPSSTRVSAYLNSIRTMKGGFSQIDPDGGVDQGTFVISKPGRMRFEYKPPAPTLIVSDGTTVAVQNTQAQDRRRYPLVADAARPHPRRQASIFCTIIPSSVSIHQQDALDRQGALRGGNRTGQHLAGVRRARISNCGNGR